MHGKSRSDDLKDVIMYFTERLLLVCLSGCFCFLLFGVFCHFKWDFLFVLIPPPAKNTIPTLKRLRCYACSVGLLDGLSEGSKREAQAFIKVYYGHGNNPPNLKVEQYRGTSLHFSLWNAANATVAMLGKCFEMFWNFRSIFSSRSLKVWSSFWHERVISWRKSWEWVFPVWGSPRPFTQWLLGYAASPLVTSSCSRVCLEVITTQCLADLTLHGVNKKSLLQLAAIADILHWNNYKLVLNLRGLMNCHWQSKSSLKPKWTTQLHTASFQLIVLLHFVWV